MREGRWRAMMGRRGEEGRWRAMMGRRGEGGAMEGDDGPAG